MMHITHKRRLIKLPLISLMLLISTLILFVATAWAGGWAVVVLDALPVEPYAGETFEVGFMVQQHGITPANTVQPYLVAHNQETGKTVKVEAVQQGPVGHFVVDVVLPSAGIWAWEIRPEPFGPMPWQFEPLTVLPARPAPMQTTAAPASVPWSLGWLARLLQWSPALDEVPEAPIEDAEVDLRSDPAYGRALFVAKGCPACHMHSKVSDLVPGPVIGPNLTDYQANLFFVRQWLRNPQSIRPNTQMPNLELSEGDIDALITFLSPTTQPSLSQGTITKEAREPKKQTLTVTNETDKEQSVSSADLFLVRAQGHSGPLVAYEMPAGREAFSLPAGIPSADGSHYFAATHQSNNTSLSVFETETGQLNDRFTFAGQWRLSGISPTGQWVALIEMVSEENQVKTDQWQTAIQIVETETGQVAHTLELNGNFEVEVISAKGDALFLIEYLPAVNPTQYRVRLYDLSTETLQPGALRDKRFGDELMTGLAWGGVASTDGRWLLTLYLNTQGNVAFIHALNLEEKFPVCIFLPSGDGDFAKLKAYSLTLSPDGQTVYAANAALGVVAEISLQTYEVTRHAEFTPTKALLPAGNEGTIPTNYSTLSNDGQMLYFSSGQGIWQYEDGQVSGPYLEETQIQGLGLGQDNGQLYAATDASTPIVIDLESGTLP